jgi:hypothetical protein
MSIATAIRPMLPNLVRMLGSDKDGEALDAARALKRVLKAHGADFHTLAALIEAPSPSPSSSFRDGSFRDSDDEEDDLDWEVMVDICVAHLDRFREKEQQFLESMQRWRGEPTEKQLGWLVALFERVRRAA